MKYVLAKKISNGVPIALIYWKQKDKTEYVVAQNCPFEDMIDDEQLGDFIQVFNGNWGRRCCFDKLTEAYKFYTENYA